MAIRVNIIEEEWDSFVKTCFPSNMPRQQYYDLRRTFYGGAGAFLNGCMKALNDEIPDKDLMINISRELKEFTIAVLKGEK